MNPIINAEQLREYCKRHKTSIHIAAAENRFSLTIFDGDTQYVLSRYFELDKYACEKSVMNDDETYTRHEVPLGEFIRIMEGDKA